MLYKNFTFLVNLSKRKLKTILSELNLTNAALTRWKKGGGAHSETLRRIAIYFSNILNLNYDLFDGGQALLEKDFEEIVTSHASAQDLQKDDRTSRIPDSDNINGREQIERLTTGQDLTEDEKGLIAFIRKQTYGNPDVPLTEKEIISLKRLIGTVGGSVERHRIIIDLLMNLRGWDAGPEERKRIQDQHRKRLDDEVD